MRQGDRGAIQRQREEDKADQLLDDCKTDRLSGILVPRIREYNLFESIRFRSVGGFRMDRLTPMSLSESRIGQVAWKAGPTYQVLCIGRLGMH